MKLVWKKFPEEKPILTEREIILSSIRSKFLVRIHSEIFPHIVFWDSKDDEFFMMKYGMVFPLKIRIEHWLQIPDVEVENV